MEKEPRTRLPVHLPKEVKEKLKQKCGERGISRKLAQLAQAYVEGRLIIKDRNK
jgi:hypothetical protein